MTQYIYIASPRKLLTGSRGATPISPDQPNVFKNDYDFTHLFFEGNYDQTSKQRFFYSSHFTFKHQVAVSHNFLPLQHEYRGKPKQEKCLELLYAYIAEAFEASGGLELMTCVSGLEDQPLEVKRVVRWKDITKPSDLVLVDHEFWEIIW